ncbi:thymidylate kinase [Nitrospira sp. KM1]|uniref:dTMP kinase n=1 Tax=Nitrospira sp. KM1 TaxID=1936990 RepID=UPI0013A76DBE|nr:dTMP kinase [Nitrospira sp. KM1]BCA54168.1 thymidylate kinase [Nitrospira sp. KM1]
MARRIRKPNGFFITLEGPEGSGKSTQADFLAVALKKAGFQVIQTREPGGTKVAEAVRHILLNPSKGESITAETEALLILAARSQHVAHLIQPALDRGAIVLCDRYFDSTLAYQGFGRGLDLNWLTAANNGATGGLIPDLTLLLDLPVSVGLARRRHARGTTNRLDRETERFHRSVRRGFLSLAKQDPRRIRIIRARRSIPAVRAEIETIVLNWITTRRGHRS